MATEPSRVQRRPVHPRPEEVAATHHRHQKIEADRWPADKRSESADHAPDEQLPAATVPAAVEPRGSAKRRRRRKAPAMTPVSLRAAACVPLDAAHERLALAALADLLAPLAIGADNDESELEPRA